jgi:dolichol-phosphate mannosyltransferase
MSDSTVQYSVIMPIGSRVDDIESLLNGYVSALKSIDGHFEIIAVLDGEKPELLRRLQDFTDTESCLRIFQFSRPFGESAALTAGLEEARGDIIITLPAYWQVEASEIATLVRAVTNDDDMLIGVRWPRAGSTFERIRRGVFHGTLRLVTGLNYRDLGCGVRLRYLYMQISIGFFRSLPYVVVFALGKSNCGNRRTTIFTVDIGCANTCTGS